MNPLRKAIVEAGFGVNEAMNALTNARLISDNAVTPEDVAEPDQARAIRHILRLREQANQRKRP